MWIRLARVTMEEQNNVGHALRLLVESERYAKAFDDGHALLAIAELRARIALRKGDTEQAASDLAPCLAAGPNTPVVDVHVATERTLLQSRILTLQRNQHAAKKLIRKFQTQLQNISSFAASCSQERGAKARAGFAADLDIHAAGARLSVALADLLCEEVVGLKSRDSPWKDEWAKCRSTYQESVETMERTDDVRALPAACQAWAQAILRVEGEDGSDEVTSELSPLVLQLLERAEFHAAGNCERCVPVTPVSGPTASTDTVASSSVLSLSLPVQRELGRIQIRIGKMLLARGEQKYHKEALRTRKQRNQERRMGIAAGGGDDQDNVVTQWLERTAPPPALSAEDCEVQHGALAMSRFSSALAACGRVDGMRASALTSVGRSALQMARETGQCTGTWPQTMARDADAERLYALNVERAAGTGHLARAKDFLRRGMEAARAAGQWGVCGAAAKGIADSHGVYDPSTAATAVCLWQSCNARARMGDIFRTACRPTCPELSFVQNVDGGADGGEIANPSLLERHYLNKASVAWRRMDCSADPKHILSMLPAACPVLCLECEEDFSAVYVAALRHTGVADEQGVPGIAAAVYRHPLDRFQRRELKTLIASMADWRKRLPTVLSRGSGNATPSMDRAAPSKNRGGGGKDEAETELRGLVAQMDKLLNPALATADVLSVLQGASPGPASPNADVTHAVLCVDLRLQLLPLEQCQALKQWRLSDRVLAQIAQAQLEGEEGKDAAAAAPPPPGQAVPATSRDFSLHVLGDRLRSAGGEVVGDDGVAARSVVDAPSADLGQLRFIVDARYEDRPDETKEQEKSEASVADAESDASAAFTVTETFDHLRDALGGSTWAGVRGADSIPSWAEWQRSVRAAATTPSGGVFLAYGLGPTLAHFPPKRVAGMSAAGLRLAMLVGRSATGSSLRRLAKLANKKTNEESALEGSVETAVLLSLCGVDTIVGNRWATSLTANRRLALALLQGVKGGSTVGTAVDAALERGSARSPAGAGSVAGSAATSRGSSRPATSKSKKGKKGKGKKEAKEAKPPPAAAKPAAAGAAEEDEKPKLKLRVSANVAVFGLPHTVC